MKRLLAVVVAVALIGLALFVRNNRDSEDDDVGEEAPAASGLVCTAELEAVCRGLTAEVVVEEAAVTFERLTTEAAPDLGAWLVFDTWPAMVDAQRAIVTLDPLFTDRTTVLGRSRLAAVGPDDLGPCGWRCLGDRSNTGDLRLGVPTRRGTQGLGLLVVGAATAGYFERADIASNDFDQPFEDWIAALVAGVRIDRAPVERLLQSRAFFDVAVSSESDAGSELSVAAPDRKAGLALLYPDPVASVDVVLAGTPGALAGPLTERLTAAGWSAPDPATPTGLPNAGVLLALRQRL